MLLLKYHNLNDKFTATEIIPEHSMNAIGYSLLQKKQVQAAITIFKLNAEIYPDSWNVYDSLGEAFMKNGDKKLAIKNHSKSLELNPQNENAVEMLKNLSEKID